MDYKTITEKEGYRREDLTNEQQEIMKWIDYIIEDFETIKDNLFGIDDEIDDETIIGKLKKEYALKVLDFAFEWLDQARDEIQIGLAEANE